MSEPGIALTTFLLNGTQVSVPGEGTLLTALRERLDGIVSVKDGCAPQGQCGCCTVWVDGEPRVSCVTPVTRIAGRSVTTLEGLDDEVRNQWAEALYATGASQCGFCTPGIIMRLAAEQDLSHQRVDKALLAHVCRCTGWHTIRQAANLIVTGPTRASDRARDRARDHDAAHRRAELEGGAPQRVGPAVALGAGGFAEDRAPADADVAVMSPTGEWVVSNDVASARRAAGVIQGRKSTVDMTWPVSVDRADPRASEWVHTLTTTWVEPAYLEPDAVWCMPGGEPVGPLLNGGAFGGKSDPLYVDDLRAVARRLADEYARPMRVVLSREDVVRTRPKRPPMALAVREDGSGTLWVARTPGVRAIVQAYAPDWDVHEVDVLGPPTSMALRAAGWAEIAVARCSVRAPGEFGDHVIAPNGSQAWAQVRDDVVSVRVMAGAPLDEVVLRSFCIGAAHMALGWVRTEGIAVDAAGVPVDLTMRSFGVLRAMDTPRIDVEIVNDSVAAPVNASDAVFAAVAAAAWRHHAFPTRFPLDSQA